MINDVPQQKLCEIIARYSVSVCDDPRRCEGLLRDYCGGYRREIHALVSALKDRTATELLSASEGIPSEVLVARLTKRLQDNLGLAQDVARWALESWGVALGKLSSTDLQKDKGKKAASVPVQKPHAVPIEKPTAAESARVVEETSASKPRVSKQTTIVDEPSDLEGEKRVATAGDTQALWLGKKWWLLGVMALIVITVVVGYSVYPEPPAVSTDWEGYRGLFEGSYESEDGSHGQFSVTFEGAGSSLTGRSQISSPKEPRMLVGIVTGKIVNISGYWATVDFRLEQAGLFQIKCKGRMDGSIMHGNCSAESGSEYFRKFRFSMGRKATPRATEHTQERPKTSSAAAEPWAKGQWEERAKSRIRKPIAREEAELNRKLGQGWLDSLGGS